MKQRSTKREGPEVALFESRSLAKGIQILEFMAGSSTPATLKDISDRIELGKASSLRLIKTLLVMGYLERDDSDNYSLGRDWPSPRQQQRLRAVRENGDASRGVECGTWRDSRFWRSSSRMSSG